MGLRKLFVFQCLLSFLIVIKSTRFQANIARRCAPKFIVTLGSEVS